MAASCSTSSGDTQKDSPEQPPDRIKTLYPAVREEDNPLPRHWSPKDKYNFIGLSQNNLRVHYKGIGKTHKDAASVRANSPIPASCGIYYFEVKIISKGRDGYMGIGLSIQGVNLNRLPGWDTQSYGYHADDGYSFCSSGTGQPYGPTFTTGDVLGCCVNLVDNSCFYTKNGVNLGIAFRDLPQNLYPTVGLQTPGEVLEANFGQSPFVFDIEDYMKEWRMKAKTTIENFPVTDSQGEWQTALQSIVSTYLVHHGYCATAESFARNTGQAFEEELASIKNRQRIQRLVLGGRMGEAIDTTHELYPGLLERHPNLLFMLKCRQFIEMVNGTDSQVRGPAIRGSPKSRAVIASRSSPNMSPLHHHTNVFSQQPSLSPHQKPSDPATTAASYGGGTPRLFEPSPATSYHHSSNSSGGILMATAESSSNASSTSTSNSSSSSSLNNSSSTAPAANNSTTNSTTSTSASVHIIPVTKSQQQPSPQHTEQGDVHSFSEEQMNTMNSALNGVNRSSSSNGTAGGETSSSRGGVSGNAPKVHTHEGESDMDTTEFSASPTSGGMVLSNGVSNGSSSLTLSCLNGAGDGDLSQDADMEIEGPPQKKQLCGGSQLAIEKMLQFGRELHVMSEKLKQEYGSNDANKKSLKDAFSLLAYSDPWSSPVGNQLDPVQREPVCAALNSAILESHGLPKQPPLEISIGQVSECMNLMSRAGVGSCAFANVNDYIY